MDLKTAAELLGVREEYLKGVEEGRRLQSRTFDNYLRFFYDVEDGPKMDEPDCDEPK
jgi:hypothetical protein